jgi:hypothetical protein
MTDQERIIERVKKLLRLADIKSGGTPAEIAVAATKAQALLFEHNLKVEEISLEEAYEKITKSTIDLEATYLTSSWHGDLLHVISKPLFTRMIYHPAKAGKAGRATLVGKPSNVAIVSYFYKYLYRAIDLMAVEYRGKWKAKKDKAGEKYIPDESFRVRVDFCLGAVTTVGNRMAELYKEETTKNEHCRDLIVVSDGALDAAFRAAFPKTYKTSTDRKVNGDARVAGAVAGGRIPLYKGVGGKDGQAQLSHKAG